MNKKTNYDPAQLSKILHVDKFNGNMWAYVVDFSAGEVCYQGSITTHAHMYDYVHDTIWYRIYDVLYEKYS